MTPVRLSVALVTRNRPASLQRCLESWRAQEPQPDEIVVADDSSDEHAGATERIARAFSARYYRGGRRGLYANRNLAASHCTGTHVVTSDDDHEHPDGYVRACHALVREDATRIWTFGEKHPNRPESAIHPPTELHRSGFGSPPEDPADSAAIADGSTLYPRAVFDAGLRYDETYRFGGIWYLWGKVLVRHGWRITFSDRTFVWHHAVTEDRLTDLRALDEQLACTTYILFADALWVTRRLVGLFWAVAYTARRILWQDSIVLFQVRKRLSIAGATRAIWLAASYPRRAVSR